MPTKKANKKAETKQARICAAMDRCEKRINQHDGSKYARGLANEGYNGGYWQALSDVLGLMRGFEPTTRGFWEVDSANQ